MSLHGQQNEPAAGTPEEPDWLNKGERFPRRQHVVEYCRTLRTHAERLQGELTNLKRGMDILSTMASGLQAENEQLRRNHAGEGTFRCTCNSYPHAPNCGLDERLVALQGEVERLRELLREAVQRFDEVVSSYGDWNPKSELTAARLHSQPAV
jgi:hypothetical protein